MDQRDAFRGCLLGGAVGDALGYAVEFASYRSIVGRFGPKGITEYELAQGRALFSDDTQMTLFTAVALLIGDTRQRLRGTRDDSYAAYMWPCYLDWCMTQRGHGRPTQGQCAWLNRIPELNNPRAPGNTCMWVLDSGRCGTLEKPANDSKGCGGVMRVAPVGLYLSRDLARWEDKAERWRWLLHIGEVGARAAALTHGHELGYISAAGLAHLVALCAFYRREMSLSDMVASMRAALLEEFTGKAHLPEQIALIDKAVSLAQRGELSDVEAIGRLGQGWVAEETLAIAIYCALRYSDDFLKGVIAAVNHDGDSDSTGAVLGNILGTYLGEQAIPESYLAPLECREVIEEVADDLCCGVPDGLDAESGEGRDAESQRWLQKYVYASLPGERRGQS